MKKHISPKRTSVVISALLGLIAFAASLGFAEVVAEAFIPKREQTKPLVSMIIPDEPVIVVYIPGEGHMSFRESEIRPQDRQQP